MTKKIVALGTVLTIVLISCNNMLKGTNKEENNLLPNEGALNEDISSFNTPQNKDSLEYTQGNRTGMTSDKKMRIINLKREMSMKMQEIGRNPKLSGYEKGQQKRAVKMEFQQEIQNILNEGGTTQKNSTYNLKSNNPGLNEKAYNIEVQLEELEDRYEEKIDRLEEQEDYMSKHEYKTKKEELKSEYKKQKETLKKERDNLLYQ